LGLAIVQVFLVAVHHARNDDFFVVIHLRHDADELFRWAAIAAQEERFAVAVVPPLAAGVGLVPPGADAGFAGAAVMEHDRHLAGLGPFHLRLPLIGAETAEADVVLDDIAVVLAFDVLHLAINDNVLGLVN